MFWKTTFTQTLCVNSCIRITFMNIRQHPSVCRFGKRVQLIGCT